MANSDFSSRPKISFAVAALTAILVLLLDSNTQLGMASAVAYVVVILITTASGSTLSIWISAAGCSILTFVGYFFSPETSNIWIPVINRGLALLAIWGVALQAVSRASPQDESAANTESQTPKQLLAILIAPMFILIPLFVGINSLVFAERIESEQTAALTTKIAQYEGEILYLDEVLTMSAQMFVVSGEKIWERRYQVHDKKLSQVLEELSRIAPPAHARHVLLTSDANVELLEMEERAFTLSKDGKSQQAIAVLSSPKYIDTKSLYRSELEALHAKIRTSLDERKFEQTQRVKTFRWVINLGSFGLFAVWIIAITIVLSSKKREQQYRHKLEHKAEDLLQSNQELEQFAYVASHDLQEPLRMVSEFTKLLSKRLGDNLDSTNRRYMDFVQGGARRMQSLVHDLLMYARVDSQEGQFENVNIHELVEEIKLDHTIVLEKNNIEIVYDELPAIMGNRAQLRQLLSNLVGNAIKFRDSETPQVTIEARSDAGGWTFGIRDNGIGIDEKYYDRIFTIFQRLHKQNEFPGTGIGLAICQKIVYRHGGVISVESKVGEGSLFSFTIPQPPIDRTERHI